MRHAIARTCFCTHLKHYRHAKKACLVWLKSFRLSVRSHVYNNNVFYLPLSIKYKDLTRKSCVFVISLVQWWKLYYIYIFFTKRTTDFNKLKWNMNKKSSLLYRVIFFVKTPFHYVISNFKKKIVQLLTQDFFSRSFHNCRFFHERVSCVKNGRSN